MPKRGQTIPLTEEQRERVEQHIRLVGHIASAMNKRTPPSVTFDDLYSHGCLGLMDAARKYDPARGIQFNTYASKRITGAILDGLRSELFVSRTARAKGMAEPEFLSIDGDKKGWKDDAACMTDRSYDMAEDYRQREQVQHLARGLDPRSRHVIERYIVDGIVLKQIGVELGLTEGRTCQMYNAAIAFLREVRQPPAPGE